MPASGWAEDGTPVNVLSFNIRMSFGEQGTPKAWEFRKEFVAEIIRDGAYDFVGVQEAIITRKAKLNQVEDLKALLPEYELFTRSRTADEQEGESTPILYRRDRWERDATDFGVFWLSDRPTEPGYQSWDSACPRTVVWAKFHEIRKSDGGQVTRTGKCVYFFNTHFDHISVQARQLAAVLIADRIASRADKNAPVFLSGDFNAIENVSEILYLQGKSVDIQGETRTAPVALRDSFRVVNPGEPNVQTFHSFGRTNFAGKIDYIFVSPEFRVKSAKIIRRTFSGNFPSDHYPIDAQLEF